MKIRILTTFGAGLVLSTSLNAASTLLVDYGDPTNSSAQLVSSAADFRANDANVDPGASVTQIQGGGVVTVGAFTVTSDGGGSNFNTNKGLYNDVAILDGYFFNSSTATVSTVVTGLNSVAAGQQFTLTLYGVGDSGDATAGTTGTAFTPTYGTALATQNTTYGSTPFVQYSFVSDGITDSLNIAWAKKATGSDTSGFNGFSLTSVPEPSAALLVGLGGLMLGLRRRR